MNIFKKTYYPPLSTHELYALIALSRHSCRAYEAQKYMTVDSLGSIVPSCKTVSRLLARLVAIGWAHPSHYHAAYTISAEGSHRLEQEYLLLQRTTKVLKMIVRH